MKSFSAAYVFLQDILVNKDFEEVFQLVLEQLPGLKLTHGGMEPPQKPKAKVHPMVKLANYIEKHELRLVDFFNKFDKDGSMSVTHEEFMEGIEVIFTYAGKTRWEQRRFNSHELQPSCYDSHHGHC